MKVFEKIGAIVLAIMMIAVVGLAYADNLTMTDGVAGAFSSSNKDVATVDADSSITLTKELTAYNPDGTNVKAPVITYTYTITAGSSGKVIIDDPSVHTSNTSSKVQTKAGLIPGLKITGSTNGTAKTSAVTADGSATQVSDTIVWNNDGTLTTALDGSANNSDLKLDFSAVAFNAAGVYRYKITEVASAYGTNGVVDGNEGETTQTRYLDVYVKDGSNGSYDIYGYVCFKNDNDIKFDTNGSVAAAEKTMGFVDTDTSATDASNADKYYTFNVEIKKDLVNDQANNTHLFPFKVTFANSTVTSDVLLIATSTGTAGRATVPTPVSQGLTSTVFDGSLSSGTTRIMLADDGAVTLTGIPAGTTVTIDEYNDVIGTTYKVKTENGTTNISTTKAVEWEKWAGGDSSAGSAATALGGTTDENSKVTNDFTVAVSSNTILFTNTLEYISPTGYVSRFAPYALILVGGIVLLIIAKKHKKHTEED